MNNTLSIIIPAYNEENRIGKTLEAYGSFFKRIKKSKKIKKFEILVVLNACKNDTIGVIKKFKKKYKEIRFLDFEQGGKGFAIIEGFRHANPLPPCSKSKNLISLNRGARDFQL